MVMKVHWRLHMKNTTEHQVYIFRFQVVCTDMRYGQEACMEEILTE